MGLRAERDLRGQPDTDEGGVADLDRPADGGRGRLPVGQRESGVSALYSALYGACGATIFEGIYTVYYTQPRSLARGTFRLLRKVQVSDKRKDIDGFAPPTLTISACLKTNTRCRAACPRGDTDIEYLCSNRCRTKLQSGKAQVAKQTATEESK